MNSTKCVNQTFKIGGITQKGQKRLIFIEVSQFRNVDGSGFVKKIRQTNKQTNKSNNNGNNNKKQEEIIKV